MLFLLSFVAFGEPNKVSLSFFLFSVSGNDVIKSIALPNAPVITEIF